MRFMRFIRKFCLRVCRRPSPIHRHSPVVLISQSIGSVCFWSNCMCCRIPRNLQRIHHGKKFGCELCIDMAWSDKEHYIDNQVDRLWILLRPVDVKQHVSIPLRYSLRLFSHELVWCRIECHGRMFGIPICKWIIWNIKLRPHLMTIVCAKTLLENAARIFT